MRLSDLAAEFAAEPTLAAALAAAGQRDDALTVELRDALKPLYVALLVERLSRPLIIVTAEEARAGELAHDIGMWAGDMCRCSTSPTWINRRSPCWPSIMSSWRGG